MFIKSHYEQYSSREKQWAGYKKYHVMLKGYDGSPPSIAIHDSRGFIVPRAPFGKMNDCNGIPFHEEIKC